MMRKMPYAIFADSKLIAICDTFSKAISSMPTDCDDMHILDDNKEKVFFFKRGKPNGTLENKR